MAAKRSYPTSEVRGSGREYETATEQERPRGATLRRRPGALAGRTNPTPRPGAVAGNQPDIQGAMAVQAQEGLEELSHVEGQEGRQ